MGLIPRSLLQVRMDSGFQDKLKKYARNELPPEEMAAMDEWLDSLATREDEEAVSWSSAQQRALMQRMKMKMKQSDNRSASGNSSRRFWMQIAAAVAVVAIASWLIIPRVFNPVIEVTDARNDMRKMMLADGTLVWLKGESSLQYSDSVPSRRQAILAGEALFEVAKDPNRPFIITCGEISVRVVGTSFTLRQAGDSISVVVLTGKVKLYSKSDTTGMVVLPNQQVSYNTSGTFRKEDDIQPPAYVRTTEYAMAFSNATLDDIFGRIEKKFNTTVVLANPSIGNCKMTADFTDLSLESTLTMIASVHDIGYRVENTTVTITGTGCP